MTSVDSNFNFLSGRQHEAWPSPSVWTSLMDGPLYSQNGVVESGLSSSRVDESSPRYHTASSRYDYCTTCTVETGMSSFCQAIWCVKFTYRPPKIAYSPIIFIAFLNFYRLSSAHGICQLEMYAGRDPERMVKHIEEGSQLHRIPSTGSSASSSNLS